MNHRITRAVSLARNSLSSNLDRREQWLVFGVSLLALLIFLSTIQTGINGSGHPYATDVGEIQNALPRWGTLHFTGYPLYTALGSLFVNGLQLVGIAPAASASLYSALWGAASIGLLTWLMLLFDVPANAAAVAALLFALSTSMWIDASIAELHTMTMALTFAALVAGVRFFRSASAGDLYWLAFLSGQGLAHQRAFAFLAPALALLALPLWRIVTRRWAPALGLFLLGPLTYIYLPLVDGLGSEWVFSAPGTWEGLQALILDTKADRIISAPESPGVLWDRVKGIVTLLNDDWPWPLWSVGLIALSVLGQARTIERIALCLSWLLYFLLSVFIWEGYVSDALLAVKLPVIAMAAVGLGFLISSLSKHPPTGRLAVLAGVGIAVILAISHRPVVLEISRDPGAEETIALAEQIPRPPDNRPVTLMALWGNDYWQLAYAQRYQDRFPWFKIVDHNADFRAIIDRGERLYTLSRTLYERPVAWWEHQLESTISLDAVAPEIIEIRPSPRLASASPAPLLALENGVVIQDAVLQWEDPSTLRLQVDWLAERTLSHDYSVAVHLVKADPPAGPDDILAQADRAHPVEGWYPTTRWSAGEAVRDYYRIPVDSNTSPAAVRIGMYRQAGDSFKTTDWLSLPIPAVSAALSE